MKLLALDPGKTTGWAEFEDAKLQLFDSVSDEHIFSRIAASCPDILVVEDYIIRQNKKDRGFNHEWQSPFALEVIGAARLRAIQLDAVFKKQQPSQKPVGYGWAGMPYKVGAKNKHHMDAIAHGVIWLVKNGKMKPGDKVLG